MSIIIKEITPVVSFSAEQVIQLCTRPYSGRPHGCPNFNKRRRCPPNTYRFEEYFDMDKPFYVVAYAFDLKSHVDKMKLRHPNWTEKQLRNCLYWQHSARKALKEAVLKFLKENKGKGYRVTFCPEAMGVNVFSTMSKAEIPMQWPPKTIAYKVAIIGVRKKQSDNDNFEVDFPQSD